MLDCGILEGRPGAASRGVYHTLFDEWAHYGHSEKRIEEGETFLEVGTPAVSFIQGLTKKHGHTQANIGLVGHGGIHR